MGKVGNEKVGWWTGI